MYSNVLTFFEIKYHFKMHKKMAPTVTFGESCHTSTMFWLLGFVSAITSVGSFSLFLRLSYGSEHYFCIAVASLVILQLLLTFYKLYWFEMFVLFFQMDKYCTCSSSKRAHVETGTTPNKPDKKRSTPVRGTSRKSLFSDGIDQTDRTPLAEVHVG